MIRPKGIAKTPREHFMRAVEDELAKVEQRERAFQQAERNERAARLRLPLPPKNNLSISNHERT